MKKTVKIYCTECSGTGLYAGMAEKDGCAVVCYKCGGTGAVDFNYEEFEERKKKEGVKRVFSNSYGYGHCADDFTTKEGKTIRFSAGGCTYEEWEKGKFPMPVKDLYCPYLWDNCGIGNEPLSLCGEANRRSDIISKCACYANKNKCWEEFDKGNVTKEYIKRSEIYKKYLEAISNE
jgi:hypothetical protein